MEFTIQLEDMRELTLVTTASNEEWLGFLEGSTITRAVKTTSQGQKFGNYLRMVNAAKDIEVTLTDLGFTAIGIDEDQFDQIQRSYNSMKIAKRDAIIEAENMLHAKLEGET